jgi:hypothetical protein
MESSSCLVPFLLNKNMDFAIVTGASGGIGRAIALELASRGYNLLLIARNQGALQSISQEITDKFSRIVHHLSLDLSLESSPAKVLNFCKEQNIDPSVLVNNAGYGLWGDFESLSVSEQLNMMHLNMDCMVNLTHMFLPHLKSKVRSFILNISSTAAYQAVPTMTVYAASKSFVVSFSRGLRHELKNTSVSVSVASPGPVSTGFMNRAGMKESWLIKRSEKYSMTPEEVAKKLVNKMLSGSAEIVPGVLNAITAKLTSFSPKTLAETIAAKLYKK